MSTQRRVFSKNPIFVIIVSNEDGELKRLYYNVMFCKGAGLQRCDNELHPILLYCQLPGCNILPLKLPPKPQPISSRQSNNVKCLQ